MAKRKTQIIEVRDEAGNWKRIDRWQVHEIEVGQCVRFWHQNDIGERPRLIKDANGFWLFKIIDLRLEELEQSDNNQLPITVQSVPFQSFTVH